MFGVAWYDPTCRASLGVRKRSVGSLLIPCRGNYALPSDCGGGILISTVWVGGVVVDDYWNVLGESQECWL